MEFTLRHNANGVWYGTFAHLEQSSVRHGVSTRLGGSSILPFASLNLGLHTGDEAEKVIINRQRFCEALKINALKIVTAEQTHGDKVAIITQQDIGKGSTNYNEAISDTDALVTNVPDIPLMLFFADCVPVLIFDPVRRVAGVSHAGWKGTVAKIAQKTVLAMQENFGTKPGDCLVGIGPSIGPCCYEVDDMVINQLKQQFTGWEQLAKPHGQRWRLNLWQANRVQLEEIGVSADNIVVSGVCTACNSELYYSYRTEKGRTGRIGAVITL